MIKETFCLILVVIVTCFCSVPSVLAKSLGNSKPTIIETINIAAAEVGDGTIVPVSEMQKSFINNAFVYDEIMPSFKKYMEAMVTDDTKKMNGWLESKGFDMKMNIPSGGVGVANVCDILLDWIEPGKKDKIKLDNGKEYPAVLMENNPTVMHFYSKDYQYPLIVLKTVQNYWVVMVETDKVFNNEEQLSAEIKKINEAYWTHYPLEYLYFPMIDLKLNTDISWLKGMKTGGKPIDDAKMQVNFKMNDKGARAKAAAAITYRGLPTIYKIKKPFIAWISPAGKETVPVFEFYCDYDVWKDPGKL